MTLNYSFTVKALGTDPIYGEEYTQDENCQYEVDLTTDEVVDYLTEGEPKIKKEEYATGIRLAEYFIDFDKLEKDEDFIRFMQEKYHDEAYGKWLEERGCRND